MVVVAFVSATPNTLRNSSPSSKIVGSPLCLIRKVRSVARVDFPEPDKPVIQITRPQSFKFCGEKNFDLSQSKLNYIVK